MISHLNNITISTSYGREALEVLGDSTSGALNKGGIFSKATIISDLNSRMDWITEAAEKYHRIMLDEGGQRLFVCRVGDYLRVGTEYINGYPTS